jgi:hypothetical protein
MQFVGKWLWRIGVGLFFLLAVILAANTFFYLNFDPNYKFLRFKQDAIATGWYLPAYYSHVLLGGIILVAGFLQFNVWLRANRRKLHRALGYVYIMGILFFVAPGGMVMSFFVGRGPLVELSFIAQCSLWFWFTAVSLNKIKQRNIAAHEEWVIRSYSLTLAAITLRIYIFATSGWMDLANPSSYAILAWLSWLPNLLIAEWAIRRRRVSFTVM